MEIAKEWIDQQRALCNAATPSPWESKHYGRYEDHDECCIALPDDSIEPSKYENADFIAAARTALPAALDALEASMAREAEKDAIIARVTAERDAAVCDMFGCMSTQGQCVRCKKRYCCDGTDDDKFSPLCKNNSHCYAWEWRGLHADNTDAPTGAESEGEHA